MSNSEIAKEFAVEVISQIGSGFFKSVLDGQIAYDENTIMFRAKTDKLSRKIVIKLNAMDTYDIEIWKVEIYEKEPFIYTEKVSEINDVYCDQLTDILNQELGL